MTTVTTGEERGFLISLAVGREARVWCTAFSFVHLFPPRCKNLIDLRKHLDTHSKEPAYRCEFEACSFTARSLCSIKLHYRKVHEVGRQQRVTVCVISSGEAEKL